MTGLTPEREQEIRAKLGRIWSINDPALASLLPVGRELLAALDAERARNRKLEAAVKALGVDPDIASGESRSLAEVEAELDANEDTDDHDA